MRNVLIYFRLCKAFLQMCSSPLATDNILYRDDTQKHVYYYVSATESMCLSAVFKPKLNYIISS